MRFFVLQRSSTIQQTLCLQLWSWVSVETAVHHSIKLTHFVRCCVSEELNLSNRFSSLFSRFVENSGNVVGSKPYEVGQPSCQSHGMYPSSRYSGLCISTQKYYTPQNEIITQNTYTFKTERINPVKYQTYKKNTFTGQTQYQAPVQQQQTSAHDQAVQAYEQALADYNQPGLSYEDAQEKYQIALQYYAAAYSQPKKQAQRRSGSYSRQPTSQRYNWAAYFGKK